MTPERNLPLDLYILIDFSASMGQEFSIIIQNISSQIGKFVLYSVITGFVISVCTFCIAIAI